MANEEHVKIIKKGVSAWNQWRQENTAIQPDLSEADLRAENLPRANLSNTLLNGAKLVRTSLREADLRNANLKNAKLRWANLSGADLTGAELVSAEFYETTLDSARLDKANLSKANFSKAKLHSVSLDGADLSGANFSHADLRGSKFEYANLAGANFESAILLSCRLLQAKLNGANLTRANLSGANLIGSSLEETNLSEAQLPEIKAQRVDFSNAKINGANFFKAIADEDRFGQGQLSNEQRKQLGFSVEKTVKEPASEQTDEKQAKYGEGKYGEGVYGGKNDVQAIIEEALEMFKNNKHSEAIELCDKVLSINPNNMKALELRGTLYSSSGKYDEAIKQFDVILQKEPNNVGALEGKGLALLNKKDYDATYDTFELLATLDPGNIIAWHSMGESLFYRESFDAAIKCLDKAIEINPHSDSSWVMKAKALLKQGENDNAINCLDEALKHAANKSYVLLEKGIAYRELGKKSEEFNCYNLSIENNPKYIQAYMQKAHVLEQDEDYDGAIECFRKGIDNDLEPEKEAILWHNLAGTYLRIHNYEEAYRSINRSLELYDNEHTRMVRDSIEREMSSKGAGGDEDFRNVFRENFMAFLINEKKFPRESLNHGIVAEAPDMDLAVAHPDTDESLAVFDFKSGHYGKPSLKVSESLTKTYKEGFVGKHNPFVYIVDRSEESNENFVIFEVEDDGTPNEISYEGFPTYKQILFASPLSGPGRRIYRELTRLARDKHGFNIYAPCQDYIDLQIKKNKRTAAQIHRLSDSDDNISLVLAGYQKDFPKEKFPNYIIEGEIKQLSGYTSKSLGEKNWLEGNLGHQQLKYEAGVYILRPGVLVLNEVENEVSDLLELAKKNAERDKEPEEIKVSKYGKGHIATIQMDRLSKIDLLGRDKLVRAFAGMFVHTEEVEGFTVALLGDWGEGKSTVMKLLKESLSEKNNGKFEFATFNAWEYERTDNIAAGLAQEVVNGLIEPLQQQCWERQKLRFKFALKEYKGELCRLAIYSLVAILIIFISHVFFENNTLKGLGLAGGIAALIFLLFKSLPTIIEHPIAIKLETYLKLPNYGKHLGDIPIIQSHLKTLCSLRLVDNKKLIVFVDDLDRCQTDCIARALDAIRLVMSIPNVIVMIGIDYRIAFKAMENYYEKLGDKERDKSEIARDYLGKIIQLPVQLIPSSTEEVRKYIEKRLFPDAQIMEDIEKDAEIDTERNVIEQQKLIKERIEAEGEEVKVRIPDDKKVEEPKSVEEILKDTSIERDMFSDLAQRFNFTNPRQLLRLRNSYRFLKVMDSDEKYDREILMKILFWHEFLNNWPSIIRDQCEKSVTKQESLEKIEKPEAKQIVQGVQEDILKIIEMPMYEEIERFVRIVVLPHSEEGVLEAREEIVK